MIATWLPTWFASYNTQLVVLAVTVLGMAAGLVGSFMLLRKQSLMGDALSHATFPGIALAFFASLALGGDGKSLPVLLTGATITGVLGVASVNALSKHTRLKDDAAMGVVLSVFFGLGIALFTIVTKLPEGNAAGLSSFIYGKTASMVKRDLYLILIVAALVLAVSLLMLKELTLLCFDKPFAQSLGWRLTPLEWVMLGLITAVTVVGLQAVGLMLILAFLITPPAAARFWTENLKTMLWLSASLGAASGAAGALISATHADWPAGAVIVLVTAGIFAFSMLFGSRRGILWRQIKRHRFNQKIATQHVLRALHELTETNASNTPATHDKVAWLDLLNHRAWSTNTLRQTLRRAQKQHLVRRSADDSVCLTEKGKLEAARITRNHRLWALYLVTHADIAPAHVDQDADRIEHVLSPELVHRLEKRLEQRLTAPGTPGSQGRGDFANQGLAASTSDANDSRAAPASALPLFVDLPDDAIATAEDALRFGKADA